MKRTPLSIYALFLFIISFNGLHAQEAVIPSGGNASGANGSVSYSVGQTSYSTNTEDGGTVSEGIQQPFEIFVVTGISITEIDLEIIAFPNPTTDRLNLIVEIEKQDLTFQLYDIRGSLLKEMELSSFETVIDMSSYSPSTYIVKVFNSTEVIKTFKIIKN